MTVPIPKPDVEWLSDEWWEWFATLDHTMCTMVDIRAWLDGSVAPERNCRSMHCPQCGKSTSSQGHLNRDGTCPRVTGMRDAWPWDNTTEKMVPYPPSSP